VIHRKSDPATVLARVLEDAAELDAEPTAADRQWARAQRKSLDRTLAAMRRRLLPDAPPIAKAAPIRPSLLAMAHDALIALYTQLIEAFGPTIQVAHRDLAVLSDDDLRRLIQEIDPSGAIA
jgi:hypothetical protein